MDHHSMLPNAAMSMKSFMKFVVVVSLFVRLELDKASDSRKVIYTNLWHIIVFS